MTFALILICVAVISALASTLIEYLSGGKSDLAWNSIQSTSQIFSSKRKDFKSFSAWLLICISRTCFIGLAVLLAFYLLVNLLTPQV